MHNHGEIWYIGGFETKPTTIPEMTRAPPRRPERNGLEEACPFFVVSLIMSCVSSFVILD